jgi:hypothetical protein
MKYKHQWIFFSLIACAAMASNAHAETVFTYQGKLGSAGQPSNGAHDFRFRLFDAETGGTQAGSQLTVSPVAVNDGVFTVQLDFGDAPFNSSPRWLEIDVRAAGGGAYTTLSPRQRVGAAPFAIETVFVGPGAVDTAALQDNAVTTNKIADGNVFTDDLANFAVTTGKLANQSVTRLKMAENAISSFHIENGTVASSDIRDGTIAGVDIANGGGLLHRKSELQRIASLGTTVSANASRQVTASCADANDIPIAYDCEVITNIHSMVMREATTANWDNDSMAASATCAFLNQHPTIGADVRAAITCLAVPGP